MEVEEQLLLDYIIIQTLQNVTFSQQQKQV